MQAAEWSLAAQGQLMIMSVAPSGRTTGRAAKNPDGHRAGCSPRSARAAVATAAAMVTTDSASPMAHGGISP